MMHINLLNTPGLIAQSVARLIADPGVVSLIPARSHTFVEIDNEIFSMDILLLPLIQEGLVSVISESMCTKYWLNAKSSLPRKKCGYVNITIAIDWDVKQQTKQNKFTQPIKV